MQNGKAEQPVWTRTANVANKKLVLHVQLMCGSLSITTPVSHLANEFDVRSELHGLVSLAAFNQILCHSRGYEWLQNSKRLIKGWHRKYKWTQICHKSIMVAQPGLCLCCLQMTCTKKFKKSQVIRHFRLDSFKSMSDSAVLHIFCNQGSKLCSINKLAKNR